MTRGALEIAGQRGPGERKPRREEGRVGGTDSESGEEGEEEIERGQPG